MYLIEIFKGKTVINERTKLVFSKKDDTIRKHYRCASGGIVSSSGACPTSHSFLKKNKKRLTSTLFKRHIRSRKNRFRNS